MAGEWPEIMIDAMSERVAMGPFGSSIKVETFVPSGVPIISGQHLHGAKVDDSIGFNFVTDEHADRLKNANVQRGDVIFTHAGNIGQVAYIPVSSRFERYVISQRQFYMRCNREKVLPEFVVAYFKTPEGQHRLLANTSQVGVPSIAQPVTYLRTIEIPLPPLRQQRAIAHILGTLDDRIEANRRMAATLEEMARALFRAWFVTFEPVRVKAEGRWRPGQTLPGLPASLYDAFPDRLVETEHGEIPKGWAFVSVGELADIKGGKQLDKENIQDAGPFPVFGGAGLMGYTAAHNADGYVITLGRVGAYCGRFFAHRGKAWVNNNASIVAQTHDVPGEWLFLALQSLDIEKIKKGAAQPFVANSDLAAMAIVKPAPKLLDAFQKLATPAVCRSEVANAEAACLSSIRDALLPKLVSGAIRVKDAEAFLKARGL